MAASTADVTISHIDYYSGERVAHGYVSIGAGDYPLGGCTLSAPDFGMSAIDSAQFSKKTGTYGLLYTGALAFLLTYPTSQGPSAVLASTTLSVTHDYWFTVHGK